MEKKYLPPIQALPEEFPADSALPEGCRELKLTDDPLGVEFLSRVIYARREGVELNLQLFLPVKGLMPDGTRWPLVVFIPGSAFMQQNLDQMVPELCDFAKRGWAVANVEYRHSGIAPFPAQAEDAKTAMRFLRLHSEEFRIDPDKTAYFGTSSGAHTALMAGITGDGAPDTPLYGEMSAEAGAIVDWFGPTDIQWMSCYPSTMDHVSPDSPEGLLIGGVNVWEHPELAGPVDPAGYLRSDKPTPPILIMHGDRDILVPFNQSVRLYERLRALGKTVEFYKLLDASHGFNGFRCRAAWDLADEFLRRKLGVG